MDCNCGNCANASDPYDFHGKPVCECRINPPNADGFPLVNPDSWCKHHELDEPEEESEVDAKDYINIKAKDGSVITFYVPDMLSRMYLTIIELEKEVQRLKEMHPNDHTR